MFFAKQGGDRATDVKTESTVYDICEIWGFC